LAFILLGGLKLFGLYNSSQAPSSTGFSGEVRLMSLAGIFDRALVVRKKIYTESQTLAAMPATAFSFVVTKKIVFPPPGSSDETALSTSQPPVPTAGETAPAKTVSSDNSAADGLPPPSDSFSLDGPWQGSDLISRLTNEAEVSSSITSASAPATNGASRPEDPARRAAFVSAVLDRDAVFPEIAPLSNWTADTGSDAAGQPQEREQPAPISPSVSGSSAAAISKRTPSFPFSLQLSSCRSLRNAQNAAADYRKLGMEPFIVNVYLKNFGGTWWRVLFGHYSSTQEALQAKKNLKLSDAIVKRTRFANLIHEYETQELTIEMKNRLESLGFSAYTIESADHGYRLFVGAYTRKSQAEKQAHELLAKGIVCRVVDR
jgi:septal ring-binding cell division protein DamX